MVRPRPRARCCCETCRCFPPGRKSGQQGLGTSRLPVFSPQEKSYIKGTCDFLGLGHFTTRYITQKNYPSGLGDSYFADRDLAELVDPQWPDPGSEWLYSVPWGFRRLLNFVKVQISSRNKSEMITQGRCFHVCVVMIFLCVHASAIVEGEDLSYIP